MFRSTLAVLASTSAILISIPARAADLPSPVQPVAPVAYAPSFSWTGFYVGGELGWIGTNPEYTAGAGLLGTPFVVSAATRRLLSKRLSSAGYRLERGAVSVQDKRTSRGSVRHGLLHSRIEHGNADELVMFHAVTRFEVRNVDNLHFGL